MIKTWQERIVPANPPYVDPEEINKAMLEEIDELRAAFANLHSDYDIIEIDRDELRAKLAALESQEPVEHQYQSRDGKWNSFLNEGHYQNTLEDGSWPIRALYLAAGAAPVSECGNCFEGKSDMDHDCPVCRPRSKAGAAPVNEWKDAVLDALANHAMDAPLTDAPQQIVKKLTDMVATMARDPAINAPAAKVPEEQTP